MGRNIESCRSINGVAWGILMLYLAQISCYTKACLVITGIVSSGGFRWTLGDMFFCSSTVFSMGQVACSWAQKDDLVGGEVSCICGIIQEEFCIHSLNYQETKHQRVNDLKILTLSWTARDSTELMALCKTRRLLENSMTHNYSRYPHWGCLATEPEI